MQNSLFEPTGTLHPVGQTGIWANKNFAIFFFFFLTEEEENLLFSQCFEPSQPLGVTSGLNTNSNLSLTYSTHRSFNINRNISTAQLFQTYTHKISIISTKPQTFYIGRKEEKNTQTKAVSGAWVCDRFPPRSRVHEVPRQSTQRSSR